MEIHISHEQFDRATRESFALRPQNEVEEQCFTIMREAMDDITENLPDDFSLLDESERLISMGMAVNKWLIIEILTLREALASAKAGDL